MNLTQQVDEYIRQRLCGARFTGKKRYFNNADRITDLYEGNVKKVLDFLLQKLEPTFSEKLQQLITQKGRKPAEIYTKAGVTRAHFAKIKADKRYHPSKETALAFAIALHLDFEETADLLKRAGYTLSHSSESDIIVEFFIRKKIYNIDEVNSQLDSRGHKTLTNWRKSKEE